MSLSPQHFTPPVDVTAQVWPVPVEMAMTAPPPDELVLLTDVEDEVELVYPVDSTTLLAVLDDKVELRVPVVVQPLLELAPRLAQVESEVELGVAPGFPPTSEPARILSAQPARETSAHADASQCDFIKKAFPCSVSSCT